SKFAAIPFGLDPTGEQTLRTYLSLCQVEQTLIDKVCRALPCYGPQYLSRLEPEDQSPSYLFCFLNGGSTEQGKWGPRFRFNVEQSDKGVKIEGWCMSTAPLAWVIAEAAGQAHELPIWRPRPDVQAMANRNGPYPAINALCSGVSEEIECPTMARV